MPDIQVKEITPREIPAANQFYTQAGYVQGIKPEDRVVTAKLNGEIVGVGRTAFEHNVLVLRGIQVHQSVQRNDFDGAVLHPAYDF